MSEWNEDDIATYSDFGHPSSVTNVMNQIGSGTDPNIKDDELEATPLIKTSIVVNEFSLEVAKFLLDHGADINLANKYGVTALHQLISHHRPGHFSYDAQLKRAQFLIDHGAKIDSFAQGFCDTPLHLAVYMNAKDMVSLLLKNGASTEIKNSDGQSPKELAIQEKFEEIVALF
jgi:ankyrin repeat protein